MTDPTGSDKRDSIKPETDREKKYRESQERAKRIADIEAAERARIRKELDAQVGRNFGKV